MTGVSLIWLKYPNAGSDQDKNIYLGPVTKKCKEYAENFYPDIWCNCLSGIESILPRSGMISFIPTL